jgi:hypothetical protein
MAAVTERTTQWIVTCAQVAKAAPTRMTTRTVNASRLLIPNIEPSFGTTSLKCERKHHRSQRAILIALADQNVGELRMSRVWALRGCIG